MEKFHSTLVERGVTPQDFQELIGKGVISDIAEAVVAGILPTRRDEFRKSIGLLPLAEEVIDIDPSMKLQDMINAGKFDHVDGKVGRIPEIKHSGRTVKCVTVRLIQLRPNLGGSGAEHLNEIRRLGFRAGTVDELLAYAAARPVEQIIGPIVALGTKFYSDNRPAYACLSGTSANLRELMVCTPRVEGFSNSWRFLVARPGDEEYEMPRPKLRGSEILGTGRNGGGAG